MPVLDSIEELNTLYRAELRRVKYGTAEAEAAADQFIEEVRNPPTAWMASMINGKEGPGQAERLQVGRQWLASYALRSILSVKDNGFKEELEWRMFYLSGDPRHPVNIRQGRPGILPHLLTAVNVKASEDDEIPRTIARLVVGPDHNQRSQIAADRELLKASGHNPDVLEPSR